MLLMLVTVITTVFVVVLPVMVRGVVGTLGLSVQGHPILPRLLAPLAVGAGLGDHVGLVVDGDADEALVAGHVLALGVRVDEAVLLPLAEAAVLALLVDLGLVGAVEDGVEHDLGVVAVGVGLGAEALGVGDDAGVLADEGAVRGLLDVLAADGEPLRRAEVAHVAEGEVRGLAVAEAWNGEEENGLLFKGLVILIHVSWFLWRGVMLLARA